MARKDWGNDEKVQLKFWLSQSLRAKLKSEAKKNETTIGTEVRRRLIQSLEKGAAKPASA